VVAIGAPERVRASGRVALESHLLGFAPGDRDGGVSRRGPPERRALIAQSGSSPPSAQVDANSSAGTGRPNR
jgi:hypothetical protein